MPATNPKLGFIGAGMMASAMINGIIAAKVFYDVLSYDVRRAPLHSYCSLCLEYYYVFNSQ